MEERRRFVRLSARLEMSYTVLPSGTVKQTVSKDVGGGGVCLLTEKPLAQGTQLQMAMNLPGREQPINAIAEVVWSEQHEVIGKTDRQRSVEVGIRSVEMAPQDQEALMHHIGLCLHPPAS
jgi:c-di-GMP-binding flagellar brake protein YcgR